MVLPVTTRRLALLAALVAALPIAAVGAAGARPLGGTLVAFVAAEDADELVAVELPSGRVRASVRVARGPHNVAATFADGRFVVVTSPPAGRVTLVDGRSLRVRHVFRGFGYPHDVELDGAHAWITDERRGQVVVLDLVRRRVVARVAVGPRPHDLAVGDVVAVTHGRRTGYVTLLSSNPRRPRVLGRVAVRRGPHDISHAPDTATFYVTYWDSPYLGAVDARRRRLLFRRRIGTMPHHVQFDYYTGQDVWVTDHGTGRLFLVAARTGRVRRSFAGCPGAHHVAINHPRAVTRAVVACHDAGTIVALSGLRLRPIRVARGPHGVALAVLP